MKIFFRKQDLYVCEIYVPEQDFPRKVFGHNPLVVMENALILCTTFPAYEDQDLDVTILLHFRIIKLETDFFTNDRREKKKIFVVISQKNHDLEKRYSFDVEFSGLKTYKCSLGDNDLITALEIVLTFTSKYLEFTAIRESLCVHEMKINFF